MIDLVNNPGTSLGALKYQTINYTINGCGQGCHQTNEIQVNTDGILFGSFNNSTIIIFI